MKTIKWNKCQCDNCHAEFAAYDTRRTIYTIEIGNKKIILCNKCIFGLRDTMNEIVNDAMETNGGN